MQLSQIKKHRAGLVGATVLLLWLSWGLFKWICSMGPHEFAALVEASLNPEELRTWALGPSADGPADLPSFATMPKPLRIAGAKGHGYGPMADRVTNTNGETAYVRVFWGCSFGKGYGVIIGPTNLTIRPEGHLVSWVPGIYFSNPNREIEVLTGGSKAK